MEYNETQEKPLNRQYFAFPALFMSTQRADEKGENRNFTVFPF